MDAQGRLNAEERDDLRAFAQRVEQQILASKRKGMENMERLVCRILTSKKHHTTASIMAQKWVEWRYGKARETIKHEGTVTHEHVALESLSDEQLRQVEQIIESAEVGSDQG